MMHPYVSELVARQWIDARMREGERQRMARGVRPEDGPRKEVGKQASDPRSASDRRLGQIMNLRAD